MQRIAIIGSGGSGKSTVARQLGDILTLPVIHLDAFFWQPDWVETPQEEWRAVQQRFVQQERWIIDGNYSSTFDIRFARADTLIFLDFPRLLCMYRVLKRSLMYRGKTRPDMNEGCPERIDWNFLVWVWNYPSNGRVRAMKKIEQYKEGKQVVILHHPTEVKRFLEEMKALI